MLKNYSFILFAFVFVTSCSDEKDYVPVRPVTPIEILNLPDVPYNYNEQLPPYFFLNDGGPSPSSVNGIDNTPENNPVTDNGATLGRVLFYDRNLSLNRTTACGSCHRPEKAYADSSPFSHGLNGVATKRNSMTLVNTRFYSRGRFFYDERAATLEDQVIMPILDHTEMALSLGDITQRVMEQPYYGKLFINAFGSNVVTIERIEKALSQFIRSIVSHNSKYDAGRAQVANMRDPFPNFTPEENRGKDLFLKSFNEGGANCYVCHTTEAFVSPNSGPLNNGLDAVSTTDPGAYGFYTNNPSLSGAFKIPTLRNITLTGPYMHDARFNTLMDVIEFYNSGVQPHPNLSPALKDTTGQPRRLNLSQADKLALFRFLNTLTDQTIMSDPRWLDPFINQHL